MSYFDSHCHLQFKAYDKDRDDVIARCLDRGMQLTIVGTQKDTSHKAVELAKTCRGQFYAAVGLHPIHLHSTYVDESESNFKSREENFDYKYYKKLAQDESVIAIGETGFDFYHMPKDVPREEVEKKQKEVFLEHIKLAQELNKPLMIHCRDAYDSLFNAFKKQDGIRGSVHCFCGTWEEAEKLLNLGLHIGFTGNITFPPKKSEPEKQKQLIEVVKRVPLDRLLIETDSPYLAPSRYRGEKCEPWMIEETAKKIAELKGVDVSIIKQTTSENGQKLFGIEVGSPMSY